MSKSSDLAEARTRAEALRKRLEHLLYEELEFEKDYPRSAWMFMGKRTSDYMLDNIVRRVVSMKYRLAELEREHRIALAALVDAKNREVNVNPED